MAGFLQVFEPSRRPFDELLCQKAPGRPPALKSEPGPPITLGSAAEAGVRLIVWRRDCIHQIEPDPAGQEITGDRRQFREVPGTDAFEIGFGDRLRAIGRLPLAKL
jgi:hypothetical protein